MPKGPAQPALLFCLAHDQACSVVIPGQTETVCLDKPKPFVRENRIPLFGIMVRAPFWEKAFAAVFSLAESIRPR
jgi:hypothetical protein